MKLKEKKTYKKGGTNKTRISSHIFVLSLTVAATRFLFFIYKR